MNDDNFKSFSKRKLRTNILSNIFVKKNKIDTAVINSDGDIISFNKIKQDTKFWKCKFIQILIQQMPQK